ncbi:MAG: T9SS type A sorting domain-containing protein [Bacteroidia bacterium]|nr:T9SS type A sorting domain-containing protein [Bacteroidia bacterium]
MKKIYLLTLLLFSLKNLNAQVVFCPPGAKWSYNWANSMTPYPLAAYNDQIVYTGDTIIGAETVKKLQHSFFSYECLFAECNPTYLKQIGDTVFMKNPCTVGGWQILYNFAAVNGSSWQNTITKGPTSAITCTYNISINSISTVTINGMPLKQMNATYQFYYGSNLSSSTETITERLGSSRYLFNFRNYISTDCNYISRNLCYTDSSFGLLQYTQFPCNFANPVGMNEYLNTSNNLNIFPNPGSDEIEFGFEFKTGNCNIEFTDLSGRVVKQVLIDNDGPLNIRDLEEGLYIITAFSSDGDILGRSKFLKTH